jgi:hypothetical protein
MEGPRGARRDSLAPSCHSFTLFDCITPRKSMQVPEHAGPRAGMFIHKFSMLQTDSAAGIERPMEIMYQQPHLVPPMKMTIWDEMPPTPPPSMPARLISQGRNLASRASERASFSVRRRTPLRPSISSPMPAVVPFDNVPVRRRSFRPLELSIYLPDNRLSELPDFDAVSFIESGELRLPPRAVIRTRSAEVLPCQPPAPLGHPKPASMFERRMSHVKRDTVVSTMSDSRPSSSYEALHSHPVSWVALPGCGPQIDMASKPQNSVTVLSPMQEEFTPPCTAIVLDGMVLDFPKIEENRLNANQPPFDPPAPSPKVLPYQQPEPAELPATPAPMQEPEPEQPQLKVVPQHSASVYQSQRRVSQWLGGRSHSGSISTIASNTTTSSFAEHRKKRSQFYMLSAGQYSPPRPLKLVKSASQHYRTNTMSTMASTVGTVTSDYDDIESMTTAPTATDLQSRSGTIKSISTASGLAPMALRPIISGVPELPSDYDKYLAVSEKEMGGSIVIKEINGPLRSPIGMAF